MERNLDTEAAIIINDLDSMAQRIEGLQAHPGYTSALISVKAAKEAVFMARGAIHHRSMLERFAAMDKESTK